MSDIFGSGHSLDFVEAKSTARKGKTHFEPDWSENTFDADNEITPGYAFGTRTTKNYIGVYGSNTGFRRGMKYTGLFCADLAREIQKQSSGDYYPSRKINRMRPFNRTNIQNANYRPGLFDSYGSEHGETNFPTQLPIEMKIPKKQTGRRKIVTQKTRVSKVHNVENKNNNDSNNNNNNEGNNENTKGQVDTGRKSVKNKNTEKEGKTAQNQSTKRESEHKDDKKEEKEEKANESEETETVVTKKKKEGEGGRGKKQERKKRRRSTRTRVTTEKRKRTKKSSEDENVQEKEKESK